MSDALPFSLSSRDKSWIRPTYCIDGDFSGQFSTSSDVVVFEVDRAEFDPCTTSSQSSRTVFFQLGIARRNSASDIEHCPVKWNENVVKGRVTAGSTVDLAPQRFTFSKSSLPSWKKGSGRLADYCLVIRVYSPEKKDRYVLTSENIFSGR
jgi:hypothetical protein